MVPNGLENRDTMKVVTPFDSTVFLQFHTGHGFQNLTWCHPGYGSQNLAWDHAWLGFAA